MESETVTEGADDGFRDVDHMQGADIHLTRLLWLLGESNPSTPILTTITSRHHEDDKTSQDYIKRFITLTLQFPWYSVHSLPPPCPCCLSLSAVAACTCTYYERGVPKSTGSQKQYAPSSLRKQAQLPTAKPGATGSRILPADPKQKSQSKKKPDPDGSFLPKHADHWPHPDCR